MTQYKSWSGLKKQLECLLCDELQDRITYFLTRYHDVHNAYGRAAITLDKKEIIEFSWIEQYRQDMDMTRLEKQAGLWDRESPVLKQIWDKNKTYHDIDFLNAALEFICLPISEALESDRYIVRIFAILDRRVGKRTLEKIRQQGAYLSYPEWVKQFYTIRLNASFSPGK